MFKYKKLIMGADVGQTAVCKRRFKGERRDFGDEQLAFRTFLISVNDHFCMKVKVEWAIL